MDDQLQLDRHLAEFFSEAKSIRLTPEERELGRFAVESFLMAHSVSLAPADRLQGGMAHGRQPTGSSDLFLDEKEKRQLRKNLIAFMQQNPRFVPDADVQVFSLYRVFELAFPRFALGLLLFMGVGAGVTFASQSSAPGDFLYPFKVGVYEPFVSKLATSETSQASWEARRAQNRLKEASKLSAESKLTEETATDLRLQFDSHVANAQRNIDALDASGETEIAATIRTSLETYLDSNASIIREISLGVGVPVMGIGAAAAIGVTEDPVPAAKAKDQRPVSLPDKVKTILSLPPAVPSVASESSSSASVTAAVSSSSDKKKKDSQPSSAGASVATSAVTQPSSAPAPQTPSSVPAAQPSSSAHDSVIDVDIDIDLGAQASSSPSALVPALFDSIMSAASSVNPPLPSLLP